MHLIIGGYAQGKLSYIKSKYNIPDTEICHGDTEDFETCPGKKVYDKLHLYLKRKMQQQADIPALMEQFLQDNPSCILICDEIGNGIVPVLDTERAYREQVGRMLCMAAEQAESVERIICGISQKIK
ncbi:MAG: bifunctional adenosylcobinamide kinase/adenosylcobinamide-phosphate guanylyltransferase [Roseburia sp.]|nr:bifunctional adenosylcobinamide kinase/adenosylcobinamide-phosphate guanylyltransferase [Roseburia sp.]